MQCLRTISFIWPRVTSRQTILLLFCSSPIKTSLFILFRELFAIVFVHSSVVYVLLNLQLFVMSFMDIILNEEKAVMANVLRDTVAVAPQISPKNRVGGASFPWQQRAAGT